MTSTDSKSLRSDAQRNRQRLLATARAAFSSGEEKVTLEAIAKRAGVGIGTLYRHFPTRESLVEAVYRNELERLLTSARELLAEGEPHVALRTWMSCFADYVVSKRGMADALRAVIASGAITPSETRDALTTAIGGLLDAGAAAGTVRGDVSGQDILTSLTGIFLASGVPHHRAQAERMLDLLMDALSPRT